MNCFLTAALLRSALIEAVPQNLKRVATAMRLSSFILEHKESILQEWEDFARTIQPAARTMDSADLRDHACLILDGISAQLSSNCESAGEAHAKSRGEAPRSRPDVATDAENHALERLKSGYTIDQLVSEYRALRASVLKQWAACPAASVATDPQDIMRFNEGIDQALAESVAQFSRTLRESEAKFRTIADAMPQMIWSTLPDGHHDYYNRQWYDFTGVPEGSTDGEGWNGMFHPDDQARAWEVWRHSLRTGDDYEIQYRLRHRSGAYRWTLGRALPIRSEQGEIVRWMGTCTDIHDQKVAEDALKQVDRRKDEFLAMLAHELRNPLAPISTAAEVLLIEDIDAETLSYTSGIITRQVAQMTRLVDDLLDVSRVTRGQAVLNVERLDLGTVLDAAVEQAQPIVEARKHRLILRASTVPACVEGDRVRLVQVIANLLVNAAKYTVEGGEIIVSLAVRGDEAVVTIADNGVGIDAKLLPYIYDLFTQGERSPDRAQGGLGVGLALVKSLVELHRGTVHASSEPGRGSTFTVVLPLAPVVNLAPQAPVDVAQVTARPKPLRIVLVDDNVDAAAMVAIRLRTAGHTVTVKHDGRSALALSSGPAPEVFILDIGLPDLDGYELARRLRERPETNNATFIALTGYGQADDRMRSQEAGFDHHLVKPVEGDRLTRLLATIR